MEDIDDAWNNFCDVDIRNEEQMIYNETDNEIILKVGLEEIIEYHQAEFEIVDGY